ncbi:hypothetical protein [Calycomorphotria hydatis]|uniref:hypothetical protein n=1 Tax=Calycomorphotria hydatis TaxID=2528027 RepID=UPI001E337BB9|nr:hypothetical protein [Calycomorphotria hydatis]
MKFRPPDDFRERMAEFAEQSFGKQQINQVNWYSSELSGGGPVYRVIQGFALEL